MQSDSSLNEKLPLFSTTNSQHKYDLKLLLILHSNTSVIPCIQPLSTCLFLTPNTRKHTTLSTSFNIGLGLKHRSVGPGIPHRSTHSIRTVSVTSHALPLARPQPNPVTAPPRATLAPLITRLGGQVETAGPMGQMPDDLGCVVTSVAGGCSSGPVSPQLGHDGNVVRGVLV